MSVMKMRAILSFRYLHIIFSDFYETSHTLNRNILFFRDKKIRVRNESLLRCEVFKLRMCSILYMPNIASPAGSVVFATPC